MENMDTKNFKGYVLKAKEGLSNTLLAVSDITVFSKKDNEKYILIASAGATIVCGIGVVVGKYLHNDALAEACGFSALLPTLGMARGSIIFGLDRIKKARNVLSNAKTESSHSVVELSTARNDNGFSSKRTQSFDDMMRQIDDLPRVSGK